MLSITKCLLGLTALTALSSTIFAQDIVVPTTLPPTIDIYYSRGDNFVLANETLPLKTCFASEAAFTDYAYLTLTPNIGLVNFYQDSACHDFTFALNGYYGGYPGQARSMMYVGMSVDHLGDRIKNPITMEGVVNPPTTPVNVPGTPNTPATPPPANQETKAGDTTTEATGEGEKSSSSTFFGGVMGSLIVLSVGGVIFWKTAGKKMNSDKGKGVLPYNRVGGRRDDDILLTTNNRSHNSFELGDEDDEDEDDEDEDDIQRNRPARGGAHQERYHDDDQV